MPIFSFKRMEIGKIIVSLKIEKQKKI